ncbi:low molecular weight protein arginine phosphatase [Desulfuribacillus alkaliarsenatis]|uniref:Phosphotyrosine protein phosphatase I domain-containing protein n=1 Tax=Desulfuribacillus alkaliarsenatis TaxID=766136 RepID=A0A1E5G1H9_9FIRM|nr:low molecular weight protein arginine phosphatase [Desulfuribacillus alkaliarsenatis]OEF96768.1 hypothetical protein BHF68_06780 [Desulfuribacillus alkaliarsenatis]
MTNEEKQTNILFVCTGNTCRSPMAEVIAKEKAEQLDKPLIFQSAGVATIDGLSISKNALEALKVKGYDVSNLNHSSQVVTEQLLNWADIVLTMTSNHRSQIINFYPNLENKIYNFPVYIYNNYNSLSDDCNVNNYGDIIDPFGGSLETYLSCADQLELLIDELLMSC